MPWAGVGPRRWRFCVGLVCDGVGVDARPDFRLGSNTGEIVTPEDFAGKTLLINFWATWCAPCRQEMPMLMELQREYGEQGFQVLGIALDDVQSVRDFVQQYGINYPILVGAADVMATNEGKNDCASVCSPHLQ